MLERRDDIAVAKDRINPRADAAIATITSRLEMEGGSDVSTTEPEREIDARRWRIEVATRRHRRTVSGDDERAIQLGELFESPTQLLVVDKGRRPARVRPMDP